LNPEIRNRERLNRIGKRRKPILNEIEIRKVKIIRFIFKVVKGHLNKRTINADGDGFKIGGSEKEVLENGFERGDEVLGIW
jgi:hypothetical protein